MAFEWLKKLFGGSSSEQPQEQQPAEQTSGEEPAAPSEEQPTSEGEDKQQV